MCSEVISKYLLGQSDTLETHYRHIEHVQEEEGSKKNHFCQNDSFLYALLKNGMYYVMGSGIHPSFCPQTFSFPANSYSLHPIKLKLGI